MDRDALKLFIRQLHASSLEGYSPHTGLLVLLWVAWEPHTTAGMRQRIKYADKQTAAQWLTALKNQGLLTFEPSPIGRGMKCWVLTSEGEEKVEAILQP